jgi:hypothetical protein
VSRPDRKDPDFLQLPFVEPAHGDRAFVVDRLHHAARLEAAGDVLGLRHIAVRAEIAVAAPVPLAEEFAEIVKDRFPFVDFDAAKNVLAMPDKGVRCPNERVGPERS